MNLVHIFKIQKKKNETIKSTIRKKIVTIWGADTKSEVSPTQSHSFLRYIRIRMACHSGFVLEVFSDS